MLRQVSLLSCQDVFVCRTCLGHNCSVDEKLEFKRGEGVLEVVENFCYLLDMISCYGGASDAVNAKIGSSWKKFKELSIVLIQCGFCNESYYGECVRHLNVRTDEHNGISTLTKQQVKPNSTSVANNLLFCNHSAYYDNFIILTRKNKKFLLELKESLLIMRDKLSLNSNITSAPLYLFDRP